MSTLVQESAEKSSERPVFLFCHIPKCAGSTVKQHMWNKAPDRSVSAKRRHGFFRDFGGDYTDLERTGLGRTGIDPDKIDFVGGHSLSRSVTKAFPDRPFKPIVLIRDPLSFSVSFYNHRNRGAAKIGRGPVPFELYIKSLPKNPMIRFIMTRYLSIGYPAILRFDSRQRYRIVDETLSEFWFVGSWLHASELVKGLAREMQISDTVDVKNAAHGERLRVGDVPDRLASLIRDRNAADQALFERWGDVKWSGRPKEIDTNLPGGDQASYVLNEIDRQVTNRYIKMIRRRI